MEQKKKVRKWIYKEKASSATFVDYMRAGQRLELGHVFCPSKTSVDMSCPWLIDIGDDVQIAEGTDTIGQFPKGSTGMYSDQAAGLPSGITVSLE